MPSYLRLRDPRAHAVASLNREVMKWLDEVVFDHLQEDELRENDVDSALLSAIQNSDIVYSEGVFSGKFSSNTSKALREIGAYIHHGKWRVDPAKVPHELIGAFTLSRDKAEGKVTNIIRTLRDISSNMVHAPLGIDLRKHGADILAVLDMQFNKHLEEVPLSLPNKDMVLDQFAKEMHEEIVTAAVDQVDKLAEKLGTLSETGRMDSLFAYIRGAYITSRNAVSVKMEDKINRFAMDCVEEKARLSGSNSYVWVTCHDDKVRHSHRVLDGKTFQWDDPPEVAPGRHCHPGQDYNCRCWAVPVLPFDPKANP
jgi:SPP1 gp7 family putative phage head morphogenesis protein